MRGDVIVRQFRPPDQARCAELFAAGLTSYKAPPMDVIQPWFVGQKLRDDMRDIQTSYIDVGEASNKNFWVAELDDAVVGCVAATPDEKDEQSLELIRMSVDTSIRRRGVGSLLVRQVEEFAKARGFRRVKISTLVTMDAACSLYEKCGYARGGVLVFAIDDLGGQEVHVQQFAKELC